MGITDSGVGAGARIGVSIGADGATTGTGRSVTVSPAAVYAVVTTASRKLPSIG